MRKVNDILNFKKEIEDFIASANLIKAVNRFIDLNRELGSPSNEPLLFSGRFYEIYKADVQKTQTQDAISVEKTKLSRDLATCVSTFVEEAIENLLKDEIERCKTVINNNSKDGQNLLLTIAKTFANQPVEQVCNLGAPLPREQLNDLADSILKDYKLQDVEQLFYEKQPKGEAELTSIPNDLVVLANELIKSYGDNFMLKAKHLELRLGEITGLVGENATGKTTLLNILTGVIVPDEGTVSYPLFDPKDRKDWTDLKMQIAYVSQELTTWEGSLLQNLVFEAARHGIKGAENKKAVDYIVKRLGLVLHTDKSWAELSGGYKLRFALAKALIGQPQLLILDEPLAYLDIKAQGIVLADLRDLAKSFKKPMAILISSQHLHETESVADQMWFVRNRLAKKSDNEVEKSSNLVENLGSTKTFNSNRDSDSSDGRNYNLFELSCSLSFGQFGQRLTDLKIENPMLKTWQNDQVYFIKTPLSIAADNFIDYCQANKIKLLYFRDISQSVKTKFYEENL